MLFLNRAIFSCTLLFLGNPSYSQMYDDSLAVDKHLIKISATEYMNAVLHFTQREKQEPIDKLTELGLYMDSECDEICETYLNEKKGKGKMLLPAGFDQGISGLIFSPSNSHFVTYGSYDGPDYSSFYHYRAEITAYSISDGIGLSTIGEPTRFHLYDWSIEDLFWIDDKTIALKTYSGSRNTTSMEGGYTYFKLRLM